MVQLPSWGASASAAAELRGGRRVPIAVGGRPLALGAVRAFSIRGPVSSYRVVLGRRPPHATVRAVATLPQRSNPDPGPTLELTIASGTRFERARLDARIVPR